MSQSAYQSAPQSSPEKAPVQAPRGASEGAQQSQDDIQIIEAPKPKIPIKENRRLARRILALVIAGVMTLSIVLSMVLK